MTIQNENDLAALQKISKIVAQALQLMIQNLQPGITTLELDEIGEKYLTDHGARSAPRVMYNYPGGTCISVNDVAAHGIPGDYAVKPGDLVNLDVSAELDGYYSDTAASIAVPPVSKLGERLIKAAWEAQEAGLRAAKAGARINTIGRAYEQVAHRYGFSMIRELPGHGVGKSLHEPPTVPGFFRAEETGKLTEGLVVTFEPFVASGRGRIFEDDDGWTLRTTDGGLVAQVEHTVVITKGEPIILTVP